MKRTMPLSWMLVAALAWLPSIREASGQMAGAAMVTSAMHEVVVTEMAGVLLARFVGDAENRADREPTQAPSSTRMRCDAARGEDDGEGIGAVPSIVPPRSECADPPTADDLRELRRWRELAPGEGDPQRRPLPLLMFVAWPIPAIGGRVPARGRRADSRVTRRVRHAPCGVWLLFGGLVLVATGMLDLVFHSTLRVLALSL